MNATGQTSETVNALPGSQTGVVAACYVTQPNLSSAKASPHVGRGDTPRTPQQRDRWFIEYHPIYFWSRMGGAGFGVGHFPVKPSIFIFRCNLPPVMSPFVIPHPHTCSSEGTETIRQALQKGKLRLGEADRTRELEGDATKCRNRKTQKQHKRPGRAKKRVHSQVTRPFYLSLQLC